jgi:hypothetical protein
MHRTGAVAGDTGPTVFLLQGKNKRANFTEHGATEGSTIAMTPTPFMTTEAWEDLTPSIIEGLRSVIPVAKAHPQWWMLEIFDGFGARHASSSALRPRQESKILCLKEEGDSSHINQARDKFVAKADETAKAESMATQRAVTMTSKGMVDQWGLTHTGLCCLRAAKRDTWTRSFHACNLDPCTRVHFVEWCDETASVLQTGQSFKPEHKLDKHALLPSWWHGMMPVEKKQVLATVARHGRGTAACVDELRVVSHIVLKDVQNAGVCVLNAHLSALQHSLTCLLQKMLHWRWQRVRRQQRQN